MVVRVVSHRLFCGGSSRSFHHRLLLLVVRVVICAPGGRSHTPEEPLLPIRQLAALIRQLLPLAVLDLLPFLPLLLNLPVGRFPERREQQRSIKSGFIRFCFLRPELRDAGLTWLVELCP